MGKSWQVEFYVARKRVGLTVAAALPLFALFASVGEVERGLVATFLATIAVSAFQLGWGQRCQIWFWCAGAAMVVAGIVEVLAIDWPQLETGGGLLTGYLAATINGLLWYGLFQAARRLARDKPGEVPIRCCVCKLPVEKGIVRCAHCGEWVPGPVPVRPILIALLPLVVCIAAVAVVYCGAFWTPPPADVALPAGSEMPSAYERSMARQMLKDRRLTCTRLRALHSGGVVQGSKLWIATCDVMPEQGAVLRVQYAIYPATGFARICDGTRSCE